MSTAELSNGRKYINLLSECPELAQPMIDLAGHGDDTAIAALRDARDSADWARMDAALRTIIRTAQQARKSLATRKAT